MSDVQTSEEIAVRVIELLEHAKMAMEALRVASPQNGWNPRGLSVAITELETSQLWLANARPE